jgi:hypothetical protein
MSAPVFVQRSIFDRLAAANNLTVTTVEGREHITHRGVTLCALAGVRA